VLVAACPGKSPAVDAGAGSDAGALDAGPDAGLDAGSCGLAFAATPEQFSAPCGGFGYGAGLVAAALGPGLQPDLVFWTVDEDGTSAAVNILHNHGDGGFSGLSSSLPFGSDLDGGSVESVVVGDFNGDGRPDLAVSGELGVGNSSPPLGELALLFGDGDGGLSSPTALPWGDQSYSVAFMGPQSLVAGDFDGDGLADLASAMLEETAGEQHENLVVFLSAGTGLKPDGGTHYRLTQNGWGLTSLAVADLDGDGRPDLVVAAGSVYVFLNGGDGGAAGTFSAVPSVVAAYGASWIAVADFNGDGALDLIAENEVGVAGTEVAVQVFLGNGHGAFVAQPAILLPLSGPTGSSYAGQIAAADFTGDLRTDVATFASIDGGAALLVLPGEGDGTFGTPLTFPTALTNIETAGSVIVAASLTGGRLPDIAIGVPSLANYCTTLTTLQNECP
jgi:hypothetical protein